jgi:hypothetical protein
MINYVLQVVWLAKIPQQIALDDGLRIVFETV